MAKSSLGNTKLSFLGVAVIAIAGIAIAVYGFMQTKKAKRAQEALAFAGALAPQSRILAPIIDSATSADIAYTLANAANDDGILPQGPYGGAAKARGDPRALHGSPSWDRSGRGSNTPLPVRITVPNPPKAAQRIIIASANCRGDSSSGGIAIGYRPS